MDVVRLGLAVRSLRRRRNWRQDDLAARAGVSRSAVSRVESGLADRLTVRVLERIAQALGARLDGRLLWQGEMLDRLLDAQHASLVEAIVKELTAVGWEVTTEVSFSIRGERGSIDVLGFHPPSGTLIVIEAKSVVPDLQATLVTLDRKTRLAIEIARARGWRASRVARLLVVRDGRTARRRVAEHAATFAQAFPSRGRAVRQWLRNPSAGAGPGFKAQAGPAQPPSGLLFLPDSHQASARQRAGRQSGQAAAGPRTG